MGVLFSCGVCPSVCLSVYQYGWAWYCSICGSDIPVLNSLYDDIARIFFILTHFTQTTRIECGMNRNSVFQTSKLLGCFWKKWREKKQIKYLSFFWSLESYNQVLWHTLWYGESVVLHRFYVFYSFTWGKLLYNVLCLHLTEHVCTNCSLYHTGDTHTLLLLTHS